MEAVAEILASVADGKHQGYLSQGGFYTLSYLLEKTLKHKDIHKPMLTEWLRRLLRDILSTATVVGVSHEHLYDAVNDEAFTDLEDSFQYQCALENKCDVLVTINIKDYNNVDPAMLKIMTPTDFVDYCL